MKKRLAHILFVLLNMISGLLWLKASTHVYEIGGYLSLFGSVQLLLTFFLIPSLPPRHGHRLFTILLTVMQLFPLVCYSIFPGEGGVISGLSAICLMIGISVLVFDDLKRDC